MVPVLSNAELPAGKMLRVKRKKQVLWTVSALVVVALILVFRPGPQPPQAPAKPFERVALQSGQRRDLGRDEALGGHTLQRHIGKTDRELRERLQAESISTDSTYTDQATAEMAVEAAIRENRDKIERWLHRPGGHSNLVLDYDSDAPLGRSMRRDDRQ